MRTKLSLFLGVATIGVYLFIYFKTIHFSEDSDKLKVKVYEVDGGFGYMIIADQKIVIKQNNIPAISAPMVFCSYRDAKNIGELVVSRLRIKSNPNITTKDLKNLNVEMNCNGHSIQ